MADFSNVGDTSLAQNQLTWSKAEPFGRGVRSKVALLPSGLAVEFHQSENNKKVWYHCEQVQQSGDTWSIVWSESRTVDMDADWPAVAITQEGYVILTGDRWDKLYYWVGQLSPTGGSEQTITWHVEQYPYDSGYRSDIAGSLAGDLVEVHQAPLGSNGLFYRTGQLKDPAAGEYEIVWLSGKNGHQYDSGVLPHIALSNKKDVIEVHQVPNEELLHYRRGKFKGSELWLGETTRYNDDGAEPDVAVTDDGTLIEVHTIHAQVYARLGKFDRILAQTIVWLYPVEIGLPGQSAANPSVATNGQVALAT